ncbi:MAG: RpiB/LacA/LacB family sugar-phosphate isomerase [Candidatus Omnitrophica bacterium]|nr:RpiB/LacA/LacB family sugar-phosphate isomerase [Candidatus Omnitrophota bacterium]
MKIFVGADHRGFDVKAKIVSVLRSNGHEVVDVGTPQKDNP